MLGICRKIIRFDALRQWREFVGLLQHEVVATNGCFDVITRAHLQVLNEAKARGSLLVVGVNNDRSVRELKGHTRPVNQQEDRAYVLASLDAVDAVVVFDGTAATQFLEAARPTLWVKGGDYTLNTLNQDEVRVVQAGGGKIEIMPFLPGHSTTLTLDKLSK